MSDRADPIEVYKATTLALLQWRDDHPDKGADEEPGEFIETLETQWLRMSGAQHAEIETWLAPIWAARTDPSRP